MTIIFFVHILAVFVSVQYFYYLQPKTQPLYMYPTSPVSSSLWQQN